MGFIAQDIVSEALPDAVYSENGYYNYVDRHIMAINTAAIQELDNAMAAQVARVNALEDRVAALET